MAALTSKEKNTNSKSKKKKSKEKSQKDSDEGQLDQFFFLEEIGLEWSYRAYTYCTLVNNDFYGTLFFRLGLPSDMSL